jgi:hypothetical protein
MSTLSPVISDNSAVSVVHYNRLFIRYRDEGFEATQVAFKTVSSNDKKEKRKRAKKGIKKKMMMMMIMTMMMRRTMVKQAACLPVHSLVCRVSRSDRGS